jgi:hypothetical protein
VEGLRRAFAVWSLSRVCGGAWCLVDCVGSRRWSLHGGSERAMAVSRWACQTDAGRGDTGWLPSLPAVIAKSALETCLRTRHDLAAGYRPSDRPHIPAAFAAEGTPAPDGAPCDCWTRQRRPRRSNARTCQTRHGVGAPHQSPRPCAQRPDGHAEQQHRDCGGRARPRGRPLPRRRPGHTQRGGTHSAIA